jgi:probable phosphoglycerate mutase
MIHLHLIRHGEAEINVRRVVGGKRGDTGLTPRGVVQAERLRDRLAATREIHADVLLSSPLPRALRTAEILAPALGLPVVLDDDLVEIDPGEADGMPLDEAVARFGIPDFSRDPSRPVCPGGESWLTFMARVAGLLERLARVHENLSVVAVTHGGLIDGSFVHFLRLGTVSFPGAQLATRHTSLTHWQRRRSTAGTAGGYRLVVFNDSMHLRDIDRDERIPWAALGRGG